MPQIKPYVDRDLIELTMEEGEVVIGFYDVESKQARDGVRIFRGDMHIFPEYRGNGYACMLINAAVKELEDLAL